MSSQTAAWIGRIAHDAFLAGAAPRLELRFDQCDERGARH